MTSSIAALLWRVLMVTIGSLSGRAASSVAKKTVQYRVVR
jgi:hypothetical protein